MAFAIRTGIDYLSEDTEWGWTDRPALARRFDTREQAQQALDEIEAALEDGLDEPLEIVPFPRMGADDWPNPTEDSDTTE